MASKTELQTRLNQYRAAEQSILLGGQSATIAGDVVTHANLSDIQREIRRLEVLLRRSGRRPFSRARLG
jgi:hypothetical protein